MQNTRKSFLLLLSVFSFIWIISGCQTTGPLSRAELYTDPEILSPEELLPSQIIWEDVEEGVSKTSHLLPSLRVTWTCLCFDLETPGLKIAAIPAQSKQAGTRHTLKNFSRKYKTIGAVNTTPFDLGKTNRPVGITRIEGKDITPPCERYAALLFKCNTNGTLRASIIPHQTPELLENADYAFGGFYQILNEDEIYTFEHYKRSRTGCGVSGDGRYLYLFAVNALDYPSGRSGLNYEECAVILKALGAAQAMQFDGGHSSGLTVYTENIQRPSLQRKVPAMLGIYR